METGDISEMKVLTMFLIHTLPLGLCGQKSFSSERAGTAELVAGQSSAASGDPNLPRVTASTVCIIAS